MDVQIFYNVVELSTILAMHFFVSFTPNQN